MQKIKNDDAFASASADSFGGIDRTGFFGGLNTPYELTDFRILGDGSLEKRSGFSLVTSLPDAVDAVFSGILSEHDTVLALAGGFVYLVDAECGTHTSLGRVPGESGCFFKLGGSLYLIAGDDVFSCTRTALCRVDGYVPLVGSDWPESGGRIHEPVNLLSRHVRISYLLTSESSQLETGLPLYRVDSASVNGNAAPGVSVEGTRLRLPAAYPAGTSVEVCLTLTDESEPVDRDLLVSCRHVFNDGCGKDERVCVWGGDPYRVFMSRYVSQEQLAASRTHYPESDALYFPVGGEVGSDIPGGVKAVCGSGGELMLFGESEARALGDNGEDEIFFSAGCLSASGAVAADGMVFTADRGGVWRWSMPQGSAELISVPLGELSELTARPNTVAFLDRSHGELLFSDPDDIGGRVAVFSLRRQAWYIFSGIGASLFFECGGEVGFVAGSGIYLFGDAVFTDAIPGGTREIQAVYVSRYTDMSRPAQDKRLRRALVCSSGGSELRVVFSDAVGEVCSLNLYGDPERVLDLHNRAAVSGRFEYLRCRVEAGGSGRQRVFGITLTAVS